ncbi:hypothetical protein G4B88_015933 [Cannabis sativa]|uniref:RNase H type-1 domain-containing protein n=1 Tax=Cannabis sativa TaxID=3483 RepID=A0A7J6EJD5_CANSA|nr:hypothetical protein G4B88_015933 [Cannabis sativa]
MKISPVPPPSVVVNNNREAAIPSSVMVQHVPKWKPPQLNGFKLNVDATTNLEQKKMGIGAIIRYHNGMVVAAFSKAIQGSFRSDEIEAKALFHALNWYCDALDYYFMPSSGRINLLPISGERATYADHVLHRMGREPSHATQTGEDVPRILVSDGSH